MAGVFALSTPRLTQAFGQNAHNALLKQKKTLLQPLTARQKPHLSHTDGILII